MRTDTKSGRHTGEQHSHTVEGTDPQLYVGVHEPETDAGLRPVLLLHGFSSSAKLNWEDTGWISALLEAGRRVITVDLPGHGRSGAPEDRDSYSPSRIRADLLQTAFDAGVRPLQDGDPSSGLDLVGYSLGSRLAWEFASTQPEIVHRLVLGGPNISDPLAEFDLTAAQDYLADGTPIADGSTAQLLKMALLLPTNNIFALLTLVEAIKAEPYDPAEAVPHVPMLLVTAFVWFRPGRTSCSAMPPVLLASSASLGRLPIRSSWSPATRSIGTWGTASAGS